jgi:hypothetical protein
MKMQGLEYRLAYFLVEGLNEKLDGFHKVGKRSFYASVKINLSMLK